MGSFARIPASLLVSVVVHVLVLGGLIALSGRPPPAPPEQPILVVLVPAQVLPLSPSPAPLGRPAATPQKPVRARPAPARLAQPRLAEAGDVVPASIPGNGERLVGVLGGVPGGVPGAGQGSGLPEAPVLLPARPSDLAAVGQRIAKQLAYPSSARRAGWQGKVRLGFVLLADGGVRDLVVKEGSGHEVLDDAAIAAVHAAAPFPPPGADVQIVIPLSFRLH